jgi:hypothetical protein
MSLETRVIRGWPIAVAVALVCGGRPAPAVAGGETKASAPPDLVKLITCGATTKEYGDLAAGFGLHPELASRWGWKELPGKSGFLKLYGLPAPIVVFGEKTVRIGFSGTGVAALLTTPVRDLVKRLDLRPVASGGRNTVFGKTVHASKQQENGLTISETISLSAATPEDLAGVTVAGCSYVVNVE